MLSLYHLAHLKMAKKNTEVKRQYFCDVLIFTGDVFLSITGSTEAEFRRCITIFRYYYFFSAFLDRKHKMLKILQK